MTRPRSRAERRRQAGHPPPLALHAPHRSTATPRATARPTGARFKGCYFAGDGARRDKDGYFWIVGRIDDVLNVAGHRLGTSEVESALASHPDVAEAAVVGRPDDLKGQAVVAFVTLKNGVIHGPALKDSSAPMSARRSARSPSPTTCASPTLCPRRAAEKSCAACSRKSPPRPTGEIKGDTTTLEDLGTLAKLQASD